MSSTLLEGMTGASHPGMNYHMNEEAPNVLAPARTSAPHSFEPYFVILPSYVDHKHRAKDTSRGQYIQLPGSVSMLIFMCI